MTSWSTAFLPFLRFLSRRRSSSGIAPGAAEATGRGGTLPVGAALATGRGRTGVGITGLGAKVGGADRDGPDGAAAWAGSAAVSANGDSACAHQRHLLLLEGSQVAAHEDVQLLEHAHELLAGDAELRR